MQFERSRPLKSESTAREIDFGLTRAQPLRGRRAPTGAPAGGGKHDPSGAPPSQPCAGCCTRCTRSDPCGKYIQVSCYNLAAKFSAPFAVATRLVYDHSGLASFSWDAVLNPAVLAMAQRVSVTEDPAMTRRLPYERPARVVITLTDGGTLVGEAGVNRGDDAAP